MSEDGFRWGSQVVDVDAKDLPGLKAKFMVEHVPQAGAVLEVGCGQGKMLRTLEAHRPDLELHGCDVRPVEAENPGFAFRMLEDESGTLPYEDARFDVVLLMDVLEHVPNPEKTLDEVRRILKPSGMLVAFVPAEGEALSAYRVYRALLGADLYAETKTHIQAFSREKLRSLVASRFRVEEHRFAYHLLGHVMDATLFAAMKLKPLASVYWKENHYYQEETSPSLVSKVFNGALTAANRLAWAESTLFANVPYTAAGVLFAARKEAN